MSRWYQVATCLGVIAVASGLPLGTATAQVEDNLGGLSTENAELYLAPLPDAFGSAINTAIFRSGYVPKQGVTFQIGVAAMAVAYDEDNRTYIPGDPAGFVSLGDTKVPTIIGDNAAGIVEGQGGLQRIYPGGLDIENFAIGVPQLTIGNIAGTRAVIRWIALDLGDNEVGELNVWGIGAQHSISQYLVDFPVDLAVGAFYQNFDVGDGLIDSNAFHVTVTGSKSFGIIEPYGGIGYDSYSMQVTYDSEVEGSELEVEFDSENSVHITAGAGLNLSPVILHGEINFADDLTAAVGLSFGM